MNPFDLSGPAFLLFYGIVGALIVRLTRAYVEWREAARQLPRLTNPEHIAFLRGGENEALRIAALALLDRGLLVGDANAVVARDGGEAHKAQSAMQRAILRKFKTGAAINTMYGDSTAGNAGDAIKSHLGNQGLLMSEPVSESRRGVRRIALALLLGIAATKIVIALGRGHTNIVFLIVLTLGFCGYLISSLKQPGRTHLGDLVLQDLERLLEQGRRKAHQLRAGKDTDQAALLAAVFGLWLLPAKEFPYVRPLFPRALDASVAESSSSSSSSCGTSSSSCGSSSSSGDGGGDGGGGGGCGGCGGGGCGG